MLAGRPAHERHFTRFTELAPELADQWAGQADVADRVGVAQVLGRRAAPDFGDLRRLTYLDTVLKESTRLFPPGPYGARETIEDPVLGPYEIPTGTTVFLAPPWTASALCAIFLPNSRVAALRESSAGDVAPRASPCGWLASDPYVRGRRPTGAAIGG
ncbi:cytochrome P450 [Streptomyces sp. NPDC059994]|uniref:cytochrome P450 n=1 Tax=Streptomyces sp. NPDC059994 TaxID=3347029 RepID=UPI0036B7C2A6